MSQFFDRTMDRFMLTFLAGIFFPDDDDSNTSLTPKIHHDVRVVCRDDFAFCVIAPSLLASCVLLSLAFQLVGTIMTFHVQLFMAGLVSVLSASSLVNAFSVQPVQTTTQIARQASSSSEESQVNLSRRSFVTVGAATSMAAFGVLFQHPMVASAETIRTMDLSLPSYDTISDARAGSDLLTLEESILTGTTVKTVPKKPKKEDSASTPMTPEEKEKLAKERAAERLAAEAEKQIAKDALTAEKAAEKAAKEAEKARQQEMSDSERAVQQVAAKQAAKEKAAAKALEEEKKAATKEAVMKYSNADFVDMALPSYSESAKIGGKEKSIFSL